MFKWITYLVFVILINVPNYLLANSEQIDSLENKLNNLQLPPEERASTLSNVGSLYFKNQNYPQAINYKKQALTVYQALDDDQNAIAHLEQIGVIYSLVSDFENSLKFFLEGVKQLEGTNSLDKYNSFLLNIGTTYIEATDFNEGLEYLKKAKSYYESLEDKEQYLMACYTNIGVAYKSLSLADSAILYYKEAYKLSITHQLQKELGAVQVNLGELYLDLGETINAEQYFTEALESFENENDTRGIWHTKVGVAAVQKQRKNFTQAISIYLDAIEYFKSINDYHYLIRSYRSLSNIYKEQKELEKALLYQEKCGEIKDSVAKNETLSKLTHMQMQYDIEKLEQEKEIELQLLKHEKEASTKLFEKEQKISRMKWYIATGFLILSILLIIVLYSRNKSQKKLVEAKLINSTLEQQHLKNELTFRNDELQNFALHIVQKNELLEDVKKGLKKISPTSESKNKEINDLRLKVNQSLRVNKELEKFRERVDEVNGTFFLLLGEKFPDLTEKEKRLCALLKLNLSSKEIALLNGVTEGAITMARYRLRKKIGLQNEEVLSDFLNNLNS